MTDIASPLLSLVFPELVSKNISPAAQTQAISASGTPTTYGEDVLGQTLKKIWWQSERIRPQDCSRTLHLTLQRFEHIQQLACSQEAWEDDPLYSRDKRPPAARESDIRERDYRLSSFAPPLYRPKRDLHALFMDALPRTKLQQVLSVVLCELAKRMLVLPSKTHLEQICQEDGERIPSDPFAAKAYLDQLVERICDVGLGGPVAERAFAVAADRLLSSFIETNFGDLEVYVENAKVSMVPGQTKVAILRKCPIIELEGIMIEMFCPVLHAFMWPLESLHENILGLDQRFLWGSPPNKEGPQIKKELRALGQDKNNVMWAQRARDKLREIRSRQSYNIIVSQDGPQRLIGLLDLRELSKDPYGRNLVAQGLERQIDKQLVRPGTATVDVLDTYMLIIATLSVPLFDGLRVDPSNVLLTRSAGPVRAFLRNREDAARIVIMSLLEPHPSEVPINAPMGPREPPASTENFSGQISVAMYYHKNPHDPLGNFEGHDLLDLNWMPEPVDALSGHRFNMSLDAIGHITTIAPPEAFVKELEHILGDRLLKTDQLNFEVEMRLLKIFHARFGETQIQACENMLNDMMESAKWNEKILSGRSTTPLAAAREHDFQAKIISQASWQELRWEQLQRERFNLPPAMQSTLEAYQSRFAELQDDRHLEWVPQLGRVAIDLELQDRTVSDEVTPLQAAVIHQFADLPSSTLLTLDAVCAALGTDRAPTRAALQFWVAHVVLQQQSSNTSTSTSASVAEDAASADPEAYTLLETLTPAEEERAAAAAADSAAAANDSTGGADDPNALPTQPRSRADLLAEHAPTYAAYVVGMLTNQGAMEASRIHSLLRMLAPGGFAFDVEDLLGLLEDMSLKGQVARAGPLWRIMQA